MNGKEIDEKIKKLQLANDKLRNDISLNRSKLKKNSLLIRELKGEKDKLFAKEIMQTILKSRLDGDRERGELLSEIENFAKRKKSVPDKKTDENENRSEV